MSRRFLVFLAPLLVLFFAPAAFSQDPVNPDTVRVEQKLTVGPSQQVQVNVYVKNDEKLGGFVIPLSFYNPDNLDVKCDSIHWAARFTSNIASTYAGGPGYPNYIDTTNHKLNVWAVWYGTPFDTGSTLLCTIYFTTGATFKSDIGIIIDTTLIPPTNQLEFTDAATGNGFMPKYSPGCLGAALQVLSPNGGEVWYVGESRNILWRSVGFSGNVKLELSTNSGTSWSTIIASTGNTGTYPWTIPNSPSASNRVRVSDAADASPKDASDANFSIPDFTIGGTPSSRVIDVGASTSYTVNLGYLYVGARPRTLSFSGLPSGATAGFTPNPVNPPTASSTMNVSTTGSTPAGTYTLTIQGVGSQTHTTTVTLVVNAAPAAFTLVSPDSGSTVSTLTPTLRWHKATDPDPLDTIRYTLYYSKESDFTPIDSFYNIADTFRVMSTLSDDTVYYWKVKAKDKWGKITWSNNTWNFRVYVPQLPNTFSLVYPPNLDTIYQYSDTLRWRSTTDPDPGDSVVYDLYYDTLSGFPSPTIISNLSDTFYYFTGTDDKTYYWKVLAKDINTAGRWSTQTTWRFYIYVPQAPNSFALVSPEDADTVILHPKLVWRKATDPDPSDQISYIVYYSRDSSFAVYDSSTSTDTSKVLPTLFDDSTYYWKVKAKDSYGATGWSTPSFWSFHVYYPQQPNAFTLVSPLNNSTSADSSITFVWRSTTDPDPGDSILYDLWYADNPSFTSPIVILNLKDTSRTVTLRDDKSYYWKVLAKDINTSGRWSTDVFRVNTYVPQVPRAFSLRKPTDGDTLSSLSADLFWQKTTDPDPGDVIKYDLYYDTSQTFTTPVIVPNLNDTAYSTPQLEPGAFYWWKVKAKDTNTAGTWSTQTFKFFVPSCVP